MWITVLVLALLGAWVFFAVRAVRKGKGHCGNCESCGRDCPHRDSCK